MELLYKDEINVLVFSGGGVLGVAYIGVLKYLRELNNERLELEKMEDFDENTCEIPKLNVNRILCVSAGCFIGLLYIINFDDIELKEEIENKNFEYLLDIKLKNLFLKYGLISGKNIMNWLESLLTSKGFSKDITFLELWKKKESSLSNICK